MFKLKPSYLLFGLLLLLGACESGDDVPVGLEAVYDSSRYRLTFSQQRLTIYDRLLQRDVFTAAARTMLLAQKVTATFLESHNSYQRQLNIQHSCNNAVIDRADPFTDYFQLIGHFENPDCKLRFYLRFSVSTEDIGISIYTSDESYNQLVFGYESAADETIMGFGPQASRLNFKGEQVPVWIQRQGFGRGEQPISTLVEAYTPGASGNTFSSPYTIPVFISDRHYALQLQNSEYSSFDFRDPTHNYIEVQSPAMKLQLFSCLQLVGCVNQISGVTGRMQPLPDWVHSGALIGLGGGTNRVLQHYLALQLRDVPMAGLWIEDWMGRRSLEPGVPPLLNWDWQVDQSLYPNWRQLQQVAEIDNLRLLGYFNPRLSQPINAAEDSPDLLDQAQAAGYLVQQPGPITYNPSPLGEPAGLVDLTNPAAFDWLKQLMKQRIAELGLSGWTADYGENLPFDAQLHDSLDALSYHNLFPELWARLNHELSQQIGPESIFVMHSGFTKSPGIGSLFRISEQNTSWDANDGLQSALIGIINAGLSGIAIAYADIGGSTSMRRPIPSIAGILLPDDLKLRSGEGHDTLFALYRKPNLLKRWIEVSAFLPIFSTREGLVPEINAQVYDPEILPHFARFARLYAALAPYRRELMQQAQTHGLPLVRHPALQFPDEPRFLTMEPTDLQFMLGDSIMVAPKLTPKNQKASRSVILPEGEWIELWSQDQLVVPAAGLRLRVTPPMGEPPVYLLNNATTQNLILPALRAAGLIPPQPAADQSEEADPAQAEAVEPDAESVTGTE